MTNAFVCASACISSAYMKHSPLHIQMHLSWPCLCIGKHCICIDETFAKLHTNAFVMHIFYTTLTSRHAQPYRLYQGRVLRPQGVETTHDQLRRAQGLRPGKAHMVAACGKNPPHPSVAQTNATYRPTYPDAYVPTHL
jgi:hypothetical protein